MYSIDSFSKWLKANTALSDTSVYKYSRAVNTISNDMMKNGVISFDLFSVSLLELDTMLPLILNDSGFILKNTTGNNMYSSALKQYRMFRVATKEAETLDEVESRIGDTKALTKTERIALIRSRIGQGEFRSRLIKKYDSACIVTGISSPKLLIASHIKPWAVSSNDERLSEDNGLLLSPTYDRLFDCGLISFSDDGAIYVSSQIDKRDGSILKLKNGDMYNLKINQNVKHNLEYHRDVVFVK